MRFDVTSAKNRSTRFSHDALVHIQQIEQNESESRSGWSMLTRLEATLTTSELRRLIARLLLRTILSSRVIWDWSRWRREHQITAALAHRKARLNVQL